MIALALILPSDGDHGLFSPKSLSFVIAFAASFLLLGLRGSIAFKQLWLLVVAFGTLVFIITWLLIANYYAPTPSHWPQQLDQAKLFIVTISIPLLGSFLVGEGYTSAPTVFYTAFIASAIYCSAKLLLALANLFGWISLWDSLQLLGIRFMQMGIYGNLERMQTSVDIATPLIIFFVLQSDHLGLCCSNTFKRFYLIVSCLSNLLSFSRFLILVYLCSLALHVLSLPMRRWLRWIVAASAIVLLVGIYVGLDPLWEIVERRFFSQDSFLSDEVRLQQWNYLWQTHSHYPWLGKGFGSYVEGFVRDGSLPYSYEVQWAAFLMQFGWVGLAIILTPLFLISYNLLSFPLNAVRACFTLLFLLWLFSGFTNPFLISLTSGVIYTLFYLSARLLPYPRSNRHCDRALFTYLGQFSVTKSCR